MENHFGLGKSSKLKLKVLENREKNILENHTFLIGSNGNNFFSASFACRLLVIIIITPKIFSLKFVVPVRFIQTFVGCKKVLENFSWVSGKFLDVLSVK